MVWGASRVCLWVHWGSVWGVVGERLGVAGVRLWLWLGVHWGRIGVWLGSAWEFLGPRWD